MARRSSMRIPIQSASQQGSGASATPPTSRRRSLKQHQLTTPTPSDPEPRRSVRATKGQHKALEQLDQAPEAPKRRGKGAGRSKKSAAEPEPENEPETIRCVCGAIEADDEGEPWIACDKCGAWQHIICMGISRYDEDIPKKYFCELCRPENHKETLAAIANGEKPWEARRQAWLDEKSKEKTKGSKKGGRKRASDPKDAKTADTARSSQKPKPSPMPEPKPVKEPKESKKEREKEKEKEKEKDKDKEKDKEAKATSAGQKRKAADTAQDKEVKVSHSWRKLLR